MRIFRRKRPCPVRIARAEFERNVGNAANSPGQLGRRVAFDLELQASRRALRHMRAEIGLMRYYSDAQRRAS